MLKTIVLPGGKFCKDKIGYLFCIVRSQLFFASTKLKLYIWVYILRKNGTGTAIVIKMYGNKGGFV